MLKMIGTDHFGMVSFREEKPTLPHTACRSRRGWRPSASSIVSAPTLLPFSFFHSLTGTGQTHFPGKAQPPNIPVPVQLRNFPGTATC
jgi:hypothetical protein